MTCYAVLFGFDTPEKDRDTAFERMLEAGFKKPLRIPKHILNWLKDLPRGVYALVVDNGTRHAWKYDT